MSYDIKRNTIYRQRLGEMIVDGLCINKSKEVQIIKETPGDFVVSVQRAECDLGPKERDRVVITKEMLAAMNAATPHCKEGDRCNCGGDTPAVRATCPNWIKG